MHYYIITGASRGLGEAIAKKLLGKNTMVYCLSRTPCHRLTTFSEAQGYALKYVPCDLSAVSTANHALLGILNTIPPRKIESITLINNAATIEPLRPIQECDIAAIASTFNINLVSPVVYTSTFIRTFQDLKAAKKIVNISSTGSQRAYGGLSCYIGSKAGLSQFTKVIQEEQKREKFPVEMILFESGSLDTHMQDKIALVPEERFAWVQRFREMKKQGLLRSVDSAADHVISLV